MEKHIELELKYILFRNGVVQQDLKKVFELINKHVKNENAKQQSEVNTGYQHAQKETRES